jgi:signal transduction histidine kinase
VKITIKDNGEGIDKKDIRHIFERFYKAKNSSKNSIGIGLSLSKSIINNHNGEIEVESEMGKYTLFTIKLYKTIV